MGCRTSLSSWQFLEAHARQMRQRHLNELFGEDASRFEHFSIQLPRLLLDYSKNLITRETIAGLVQLAREADVEAWREKMFAGERINRTEERAVLHVALRNRADEEMYLGEQNISAEIKQELVRIEHFVKQVRGGDWKGYSGKHITDVVCLGVGGSNLGPQMVTDALKSFGDHRVRVHYVSNVDGTQIAATLSPLNPEQVLFVVASKTFTTTETMTNANTALKWLVASAGNRAAVSQHFVAVTANSLKAAEFGILPENIFQMWDWVGGRFSLWSAIGLPIALFLGFENFTKLLDGAFEMDNHFRYTPLERNAPVILALISLWNTTFLGAQSQAILPYDQALHRFSAYMQQAEMESNGKSVAWDGREVSYQTVPLIWGQLGIDGQHAFYQYLHQGKTIVPADFIGSVEGSTELQKHHDILIANFFAQTQALMTGVDEQRIRHELRLKGNSEEDIERLVAHKVHKGNRPTNTLLLNRIDPLSLGNLIALYEHKIFVQGVILQICSFDQWGVELGKELAVKIQSALTLEGDEEEHDSSTANLIRHYRRMRQQRGR